MSLPTSRRHRIASWLAIFAMALNALWPLLAQARPRSVALVPLCTVGGETHYVEVPLGKTPLEQKSSAQGEHCSYCTLSALPAPLVFSSSEKHASAQPAPFQARFAEAAVFLFGRPRAPPVFQSMSSINDHHWRTHEEDSAVRHRGARAGVAAGSDGELRLGLLHR
jgi:hypothetical protein